MQRDKTNCVSQYEMTKTELLPTDRHMQLGRSVFESKRSSTVTNQHCKQSHTGETDKNKKASIR